VKVRLLVVLTAAAVFGCAGPAEEPIDREADRAAIEQILRVATEANQNGDVAAWLSNLTEDAMFLSPYRPPIEGKAALREWVEQRFSVVNAQITISPVEIVVDHDLAFTRNHITGYEVSLETGDTVAVDWKELVIVERQPDGSWLVSRVMGNSNVPQE
jgi:uncharacterized protein (TIGR02246 family)